MTADTVLVRSPGTPLAPVTLEQMQTFSAPMYNRNPKLQFAFGGTRLVEGRGLGMKTLGEAVSKYGLPLPKYSFDGVYLNLTIYRHKDATVRTLPPSILRSLSKSERDGWAWLASKGSAKSSEYAGAIGGDERTARRHLNHFVELKLLTKVGSGPSTQYRLK